MNLATAEMFHAEIARLQAEIDRLRSRPCPYVTGGVTRYCTLTPLTLTDEERQLIGRLSDRFEAIGNFDLRPSSPGVSQECEQDAATLRGLLERCSQFAKRESDRPQPIAKRESDRPQPIATPEPQSTPAECSVATERT